MLNQAEEQQYQFPESQSQLFFTILIIGLDILGQLLNAQIRHWQDLHIMCPYWRHSRSGGSSLHYHLSWWYQFLWVSKGELFCWRKMRTVLWGHLYGLSTNGTCRALNEIIARISGLAMEREKMAKQGGVNKLCSPKTQRLLFAWEVSLMIIASSNRMASGVLLPF